MPRRLLRVAGACLGLALCACASTPPPPLSAEAFPALAEQATWQACRARLAWPDGQAPDWSLDVLLAHAVFGPLLAGYGPEFRAWRFHRRAGRDGAGHQFSFLFLGEPALSREVHAQLRQNITLRWALHDGLVESFDCRHSTHWSGPELGDTSDRSWTPEMQQAWPHFIQGASRLWLELIRAQMQDVPPQASLETLHAASRQAQARISEIWRHEAPHALLHHLNAIFGYQPLLRRY